MYSIMAKEIILSKESSESEIKAYFNAVLKLSQSDNEFPVNLDEVWMLVYERKDSAVKALVRDFVENEDYKLLRRKVEQVSGAKYIDDYYLTVPCLEYFIVKKIRPVFEVYRKVFHKTVQKAIEEKTSPKREPSLTTKVRVGLEWVKGVSEMLNLNDSSKLALLGKVAKPLNLPLPDYTPSHGVLKSASELLKENCSTMSAQAFNARLMKLGYLTEITRPSAKGGVKKFKSITAKGLEYGENQVNPNNPKSTQPLWYADRFNEFMNVVK